MRRDDPILTALLAPLPDVPDAGGEARMAEFHARIREARRGEDPRLPQGVWQRDRKRADWPEVRRLCVEALTHQAKDLLVAAWLVEAWARLDGLAGLPRGLALLEGLCRSHWDAMLPPIEDGDAANRLAPIEWLSDRIPILLRSLPLLRPDNEPEVALTWGDYLAAQRLETARLRDPKAFERAEAGGAASLARVMQCRERTPTRALAETEQWLRHSVDAIESFSGQLAAICGGDAPSLSDAHAVLDDILAFLDVELTKRRGRGLAARLFRGEPASIPRPALPSAPESEAAAAVMAPPMTREEACRDLAGIAALLRSLEPHSPTPYLIERALEWEQMPLPDLLAHVSSAGGGLSALFALLGLPKEVTAPQTEMQGAM